MNAPHRCACAVVSRCGIYVHPSPDVQAALNALVEAVSAFDVETDSRSVVAVRSRHGQGIFTSVTRRRNVPTSPSPRPLLHPGGRAGARVDGGWEGRG